MAVTTGTSVAGMQLVAPFSTITNTDWDVFLPDNQGVPPVRVGYAYIMVTITSTPGASWLVQREPIYFPGTIGKPRFDFGVSGVRYAMYVDWNFAGLNWRVTM